MTTFYARDFLRHTRLMAAFATLSLFILSGGSLGSNRDLEQASQPVQFWTFQRSQLNLQDWPQNWKRSVGREYPRYLPIRVVPRNAAMAESAGWMRRSLSQIWIGWKQRRWPWEVVPEKVPGEVEYLVEKLIDPCLQLGLDGGAIELFGPAFPVSKAYAYGLEIEAECDQLSSHTLVVELQMLDRTGKVIESSSTAELTGTIGWTKHRIETAEVRSGEIVQGRIRVGVRPNDRRALKGTVRLDNVRVWKMPRLSLKMNQAIPLYQLNEDMAVSCVASGLQNNVSNVTFEIRDHLGTQLLEQQVSMTYQNLDKKVGSPAIAGDHPKTHPVGLRVSTANDHASEDDGWQGKATWTLPQLGPGYYEIQCRLPHGQGGRFFDQTTFCVLPASLPNAVDSRFGWSLGSTDEMNTLQLPPLFQLCGVGRIKFPIWVDPDDSQRNKQIAWFVERCRKSEIQVVGVLDQVPKSQRRVFPVGKDPSISSILPDHVIWQSLLEPVLGQACMSLNTFQLGWDRNGEFTHNDAIMTYVELLRSQIKLLNPEAKLVVPWSAFETIRESPRSSFDHVHYYVSPAFQGLEVDEFAKGMQTNASLPYWISIHPVPRHQYASSERLVDLASTMIHVVKSNMEAAWISDPFDPEHGIIHKSGEPQDLLLPFLIMTRNMAGNEYLGQMNLQNTTNHLVSAGKEATLVMWNAKETTHQMYLGESVEAIDLYGRTLPIKTIQTEYGAEQQWTVGRDPILIRGVDADVARWRMDLKLENATVETTVSGTSSLHIQLSNPTASAVRGTLTVVAPNLLLKGSSTALVGLPAGGNGVIEVPIELKPDASAQKQDVRIDLKLHGARSYRFSTFRPIQIGLHDVQLSVFQQLEPNDRISLHVELTRPQGGPIQFDCMLMFPDRPRERIQMVSAGPSISKTLSFQKATELIGKSIWLRCEEIGTGRVLNQRILVQEQILPETNGTGP